MRYKILIFINMTIHVKIKKKKKRYNNSSAANVAKFSSTQGNEHAQEWLLTKLLISFLLLAQLRYSQTKLSAIHGERDHLITTD